MQHPILLYTVTHLVRYLDDGTTWLPGDSVQGLPVLKRGEPECLLKDRQYPRHRFPV